MAGFSRRRALSSLAATVGAAAAGVVHFGNGSPAAAADDMPVMAGMAHGSAATRRARRPRRLPRGGAVDHAANGFDPHGSCATSTGADAPAGRRAHAARVGAVRARQGDRGRARREVRRLDLQRPHPRPDAARREGERLRIRFVNGSAHPHTIHFHGIHPAAMDGVPGLGGDRRRADRARPVVTYEFDAAPFGLHLYHCHVARSPSTSPRASTARSSSTRASGRDDADELVMVMNGVRHELRPRQRGLRRQHDRLRLHGPADPGQARRARAHLPRQRARVRPDQLVPPARQLLPLLPDRHVAAARPSSPTR